MIKVVAKNFIVKDKMKEYQSLAHALVDKTREESGCLAYALYQDVSDASIMTMIEEWADQGALQHHLASKHFQELVPRMEKLTRKATEMNVYHEVVSV